MALEPLGRGWAPLLERSLGDETPPRGPSWIDGTIRYLDELVLWNQKTDLTAARSAEELVDLSLADAWVLARTAPTEGAWVDVGSGAGAPGLVLALLCPDVRMTLVEPKDRRVSFLRTMIGKLGLRGVAVERGRSDRLANAAWDHAVSRATLPPGEWLREGMRLARTSVWVLLARDEPPVLDGCRVDRDVRYDWALTHVPRRALRYVRYGEGGRS